MKKIQSIQHWIELLGMAPILTGDDYKPTKPYVDLLSEALRSGYIIPEELWNVEVQKFIALRYANPNATFYRQWQDMIQAEEDGTRFMHQLVHYVMNYFADKTVYPAQFKPMPDLPIGELKVIQPVSLQEFADCMMAVLQRPAALSNELINTAHQFLRVMHDNLGYYIDVDSIANNDLKAAMIATMDLPTSDAKMLLRSILYRVADCSNLIQGKDNIRILRNAIKTPYMHQWPGDRSAVLANLSMDQLILLSTIFHRYKPTFLAMKVLNPLVINRIRRLARYNHKPLVTNFWQNCISTTNPCEALRYANEHVKELSGLRIVRLLQCARYAIALSGKDTLKMYRIRNQKVWFEPVNKPLISSQNEYLDSLIHILEDELVNRLKTYKKEHKISKAFIPEGLVVAAPSSQKNFVGGLPAGSSINCDGPLVVGCYWRGEWGARDYDLSCVNTDGERVGWNSDWQNNGILYSGDMTRAEPEACELIYVPAGNKEILNFMVNGYDVDEDAKFHLILAKQSVDKMKFCEGYMVDPNNIVLRQEIGHGNGGMTIGVQERDRFWITNASVSHQRVAGINHAQTIDPWLNQLRSRVSLNDLLIRAGFKIVEEATPKVLDFTQPEIASTLLEMFA